MGSIATVIDVLDGSCGDPLVGRQIPGVDETSNDTGAADVLLRLSVTRD
jgi:hypothetical protein